VAYLGFGKGGHGERAEREPITGVFGLCSRRGPGAEPLVRGSGGRSPPEAETLFAFERSMEAANSPIFLKFGNTENHSVISDAISHGDFNRILYRYEKRQSNIVEFCNSCWRTAKNAPFHIKSPLKIFMVGPKGGHHTVALPLNTPLPICKNIMSPSTYNGSTVIVICTDNNTELAIVIVADSTSHHTRRRVRLLCKIP